MANNDQASFDFRGATRFWEFRRIWYNAVLFIVVALWVAFTWPHFRPAVTFDALGKMLVLALLANVCYSSAYLVDFFLQAVTSPGSQRLLRWATWIAGMLLALLIENYWIADEIFPDFNQKQAAALVGTAQLTQSGTIAASNMNFPAPLAVMGFLAAFLGLFVAVAAVVIFWFARKPKFVRTAGIATVAGAVLYLGLLTGFSLASHETALGRGQEKYFCEIDCHLAYAITDIKTQADGNSKEYWITLRTRFDEATISSARPKDAPLTPSPRELRILDTAGNEYSPLSSFGTSLLTQLKPGESYETRFEFRLPADATGLRLLLNTTPGWPDHLVIGDENSWLHKKTYFAL